MSVDSVPRTMRILLVQHCSERTGSTLSGLLVAEGFRRAGWEVDVAFGFDGPMIVEYAALGCRTHVVPHKSWLRGGNVLQSARRIGAEWQNAGEFTRLIDDVRPDLVYVNTLVSLAAAAAARRRSVPCVWHIRELFDDVGGEMRVPACGGRRLVRRLVKRLSSRRVAISRAVAENILGTAAPERVDIVPNAVSPEFFEISESSAECRRRFGLPTDRPVVGVPGTLRPMKGHPFFLEAAALVSRDVPECVYAVTGSGEPGYEQSLRDQVQRLGLVEQVRFLGTIREMPQFYRACDVVCVPSVAEPFGRTVIEAFAAGTPVVATAVGGMRETIENGVSGVLVDYGDVRGLSFALQQVLGDVALRTRMACASRTAARARYGSEAYHSTLCRIVQETAAGTHRRAQALGGVS